MGLKTWFISLNRSVCIKRKFHCHPKIKLSLSAIDEPGGNLRQSINRIAQQRTSENRRFKRFNKSHVDPSKNL